jgi:hypothetical protein
MRTRRARARARRTGLAWRPSLRATTLGPMEGGSGRRDGRERRGAELRRKEGGGGGAREGEASHGDCARAPPFLLLGPTGASSPASLERGSASQRACSAPAPRRRPPASRPAGTCSATPARFVVRLRLLLTALTRGLLGLTVQRSRVPGAGRTAGLRVPESRALATTSSLSPPPPPPRGLGGHGVTGD